MTTRNDPGVDMTRKERLELELRENKEQLAATMSEIEHRAKAATSIKRQVNNRPLAVAGIALGVGLLFGMFAHRPRRRKVRELAPIRPAQIDVQTERVVVAPRESMRQSSAVRRSVDTLFALAASRLTTAAGKAVIEWSDGLIDRLKDKYLHSYRAAGGDGGREYDEED